MTIQLDVKALFKRLVGPCLFGHSRDYLRRRDETTGRLMKECPRCHTCYGVILGSEMIVTGPKAIPEICAGMSTGEVRFPDRPRKTNILGGKFQ